MRNKVYVSRDARPELLEYLKERGREVIFSETLMNVAHPIRNHPDLIYCRLKDDMVFKGDSALLGERYPLDVRYNACSTGRYFIHALEYTDERLLEACDELGLIKVNVRQGYSKCSITQVDEESIITYDEGIFKACTRAGLDVLLISPGHVKLEGYDTGFMGGASGKIGDEILFNGDISAHPDFERIASFIEKKGLRIRYFREFPLTDIGTIV